MTYEYTLNINETSCFATTNFEIKKGEKVYAAFIDENGCQELIFSTVIEVLEENIF